MYKLKGFMAIESLVLNDEGAISPIGELSTYALTFAKDKGMYTSVSAPLLTLYSFHSALDTPDAPAMPVPLLISEHAFNMVDWLYHKQMAPGAPILRQALLGDLIQQYLSSTTGLNCGELIEVTTGVWLPEWVSWKLVDVDGSSPAHDNEVIIWLSNDAFIAQYDNSSITVVPPLRLLDVFFGEKSAIVAALAARPLSQTMLDVQAAKEGFPETVVAAESFDWVDPANPATRISTNWTFLIYGAAGDNEDSIREAIRAYIAANSTHTEAEWKAIFPDIYKNTEFLIFPRWHNYAVADRVLQEGTYSPVVNMRQELIWLKQRLTEANGYSAAFVENHTTALPCNYKSLALLITPGPDNRNAIFDILRVYPDIINVPTSDTLFELMAYATKEWLLGLNRLLVVAEKATAYSSLPSGMHRLVRHGVMYITGRFNTISYLVATKGTTPPY